VDFQKGGGFHPLPWEPRKKYAVGNRVKQTKFFAMAFVQSFYFSLFHEKILSDNSSNTKSIILELWSELLMTTNHEDDNKP
jgi:hypothetical protein